MMPGRHFSSPCIRIDEGLVGAARELLPSVVLKKFETFFGADLSDVRIHRHSLTAIFLGARAFTHGTTVHFAPGHYNPNTVEGLKLIGHELTHVLQQRGGGLADCAGAYGGTLVLDDPELEAEADRLGDLAAASVMGLEIDACHGSHQMQRISSYALGSVVQCQIEEKNLKGRSKQIWDNEKRKVLALWGEDSWNEMVTLAHDIPSLQKLILLKSNASEAARQQEALQKKSR